MDFFKKAYMVVGGIAIWGYIFALFFIEGTYHPFMKKDADTVVEKTEPADKQRTQIRTKAPAIRTGISIYTSTDSDGSNAHQLYFSDAMAENKAKKNAAEQCDDDLPYFAEENKCKEVAFFTKGCYARYRIGNGHTSSFGPTQEEAQAKAKQKCDVTAENSSYSCILDASQCIMHSRNQVARNWYYSAVGITEEHGDDGLIFRVILSEQGDSKQQAKDEVTRKCLVLSGKPCANIMTLEGDQCLAAAINKKLSYSVRSGGKKNESTLKAEVRQVCTRGLKTCEVKFFCASQRSELMAMAKLQ